MEQAHLPLRSWQDIGHYWLFIEGALPGVPIPIGANALEHAADEAFAELRIHEVPRIWLQLIARKDADGAGSKSHRKGRRAHGVHAEEITLRHSRSLCASEDH